MHRWIFTIVILSKTVSIVIDSQGHPRLRI